MKAYLSRTLGVALSGLIAMGKDADPAAQEVIQVKVLTQQEMTCQGATPREEALIRSQIQIMNPEVLPLRIIFVPHWKYVDNSRIFHLHVPAGYTSTMFTHLPSRTVFVDADRYVSDDSLGYWMAHELGHLATNSSREQDAEKAARDYRKRLRAARHVLFMTVLEDGSRSTPMRTLSERHPSVNQFSSDWGRR